MDSQRPVGRDGHLARLADAVAGAVRGTVRALTIAGEPGVGKTCLLDALAVAAAEAGMTVVRGAAGEFEQDLPFALYRDAFDRDGRFDELLSGHDRHAVHRGVRTLLENAAPVALVLDDTHWADPASVELTEYLLRRPPDVPMLLALAYRDSAAPARLLDAAFRYGAGAVHLDVAPLRRADLVALFPHSSERRLDLLFRVSDGNPLYLQVLADVPDAALRAMSGHEPAPTDALATGTLGGLLRAELDALDPARRAVAEAAAIAGDDAPLGLIAAVADRGEEAAAAALDALGRAGVVVGSGGRFRFRHPLLRTAAYLAAGDGSRIRAHARAATYLRACDGPLAVLAHHIELSVQYGDENAAYVLRDAAAACLHTAPTTAVRLLRTALRVLPDRPDRVPARLELRMALARTLGVTGDLAASLELLDEVIRTPGGHHAPAVAFFSTLSRLLGEYDRARAVVVTEVGRVGATGRPAAQLHAELAAVEMMCDDVVGLDRQARLALHAVAGADEPALEAAAHALLALGRLRAGDVPGARDHAERAAFLLDALTDDVLTPHIELIAPLAWVEIELGRPERAEAHTTRGTTLAARSGLTLALPALVLVEAVRLAWTSRLESALTAAGRAAAAARAIPNPEAEALARAATLAPLRWRVGERAAADAADALVVAGLPRSAWWATLSRLRVAETYLAAGRPDAALAALPAEARAPDVAAPRAALAAMATVAAHGHGAHGPDGCAALALLDDALRYAGAAGLPHHAGIADEAAARVRRHLGDLDAAMFHARGAVGAYDAAGRPVEAAAARAFEAELLFAAGATASARTRLEEARQIAIRCGATALGGQIARIEARADGRGVLTEREREIALLAGAGDTNRQIADRLHISQKTVEAHLSRVFTKIDVHSRVGLTRWVLGGAADPR